MGNLFSVFSPESFWGMNLNWVISFILIASAAPTNFWLTKSKILIVASALMKSVLTEFKAILGKLEVPGALALSVSLFIFIALNNFLGLAPYTFTATSHLSFTLAIALPLWLGHVVLAWIKNSQHMFAHLVPLGSPSVLSPFMVLIELVSALIRPITLSVRLAANIVAGHLLMVLISSPACQGSYALMIGVLTGLVALAVLESAVALIQAYVLSILSVLYVNEVNSPVMQ